MNPVSSTIVKWKVKSLVKEARMGKLGNAGRAVWAFLDGKKLGIWTVAMVLKALYPKWPLWDTVDVVAGALGWSNLTPLVDPGQVVEWGTFAVAAGHRLTKWWKETPVEVPEWKTIGTVPEVKPLPIAVLPAEAPAAPGGFEFLEVRTKVAVPVGAEVEVPGGKRGIVFSVKEQSASGVTYVVRVAK